MKWIILACCAIAAAVPAQAQRVHVVIVTGLAGEPRFAASFHSAAAALYDAAATWGVTDSSRIYLAEDRVQDSSRIRGRAMRDSLATELLALSQRTAPGDVVLLFLVGHGSGFGAGSRLNLPGPDATAADFATWLAGFARQTVVFVHAGSAGGDFVEALAAPGRIIVTATRSATERNESLFAEPFVRGIATQAADADKDGRTSVREAFEYARIEVKRAYESTNRLLTEHARLSDSVLATAVTFGPPAAAPNPQVAALLAERSALEADVAALRARKSTMDPAEYNRELERLLLAIADKTLAIRAAGGTP